MGLRSSGKNQPETPFHRKFTRRISKALITVLYCASFFTFSAVVSVEVGVDLGLNDGLINLREELLNFRRGNIDLLHKPFAPHIKPVSPSEIEISWLPTMIPGGVSRYELFNGDELEYSGQDLRYIAKRLTPNTEYKFKLRACGYVLGTCSEFTAFRSGKTEKESQRSSKSALTGTYLGKRIIFFSLIPPIAAFITIVTVALYSVYGWRLLSYYLNQLAHVKIDLFVDERPGRNKIVKKSHAQHHPVVGNKVGNVRDPNTNAGRQMYYRTSDLNTSPYSCPEITMGIYHSEYLPSYQPSSFNISSKEHERSICLESSCSTESSGSVDGKLSDISTSSSDNDISSSSIITETLETGSESLSTGDSNLMTQDLFSTIDEKQSPSCSQKNQNIDSIQMKVKLKRVAKHSLRSPRICRSEVTDEPVPVNADGNTIVVIDNSNIFIGARETACAANSTLRQRHIKVRLHGLVDVLERGKHVSKRFAGGSSPPANEQVWKIYRRMGYTVDLEDRRGKDEQRVDELLHLCIYKALVDLTPQKLILATGDGSKGKGKGDTSFPDCVIAALEHGWEVELYSWRHSLSAEWLKIGTTFGSSFKIKYLDQYLSKITYVDYRNRRRALSEQSPSKLPSNKAKS